jgi:rare lipoprotein A
MKRGSRYFGARTAGLGLAAVMLCAFSDAPAPEIAFEDESAFALDDSVFSSEAVAALIGAGRASYYADKFHGRRTASGEIFDNSAMTAAHPKLPMGSLVRVTCEKSGKSVTVRVNDRGPYAHNRVIDLSKAAARELGMLNTGLADVTLELLPTT